ncbi:MAG: glucokinase [Firmicutes bacterium HGW-Firmicutes-7]|nr:MAG: glucokinase [Firmicutes bacterium HGW-Firmicutes-7]
MYSIGVDLGGTNIAAAIVTVDGQIIKKASIPTLNDRNDEAIVKDMAKLCLQIVSEANITQDEIHSVGIGSPGIVDSQKGEIVYANNLKFRNSPIAKMFQKYFNKPVYLENDANAAAYGEYVSGAGSVYKDLVAITLGTGVGGGIILDGKVISGSYNAGAELGHIVISIDGELCTCGRHGCWECYSSATGLIREAKLAAQNNPESLLNALVGNELNRMNAKIPFDAAQAGDPVAMGVIDNYVKYLAVGLVNVINMVQPEVIVLGGGISAQQDNLLNPLKERIVNEIYGGAEAFKTQIKIAELGNDAGLIGASMLYKLHA